MQNSLTPGFDLSGKLIIKVQLGEDIRRIPIHNEDITYDELVLMMQRVYRGKLSTNDDIVIKYKDEDGDLITIFDSSDLTFAIQCSRILKITLFVNGVQSSSFGDFRSLRTELQVIRDRVNGLLDRMDSTPSPITSKESIVTDGRPSLVTSGKESGRLSDYIVSTAAEGKEFDPLSSQRSLSHDDGAAHNKVMSSFSIPGGDGAGQIADRAGAATPDSISSIGSSSSTRQHQQQQQTQYQPPSSLQSAVPGTPSVGHEQHQQHHQQPASSVAAVYSRNPAQQAYAMGPEGGQFSQTGQQPSSQQAQFQGYAQPAQGYQQYAPGQQHQQQQQQQPLSQQPAVYSQPGGPQYGFSAPTQAPGQPQQAPQPVFPPNVQVQGQGQKFPGYTPQGGPVQQAPSPTPPGANPYSRGGPGYGTGYPRPAGNYPQQTF